MVCFNVTIETGIKTTKVVGQLKIFIKKESIYLLIFVYLNRFGNKRDSKHKSPKLRRKGTKSSKNRERISASSIHISSTFYTGNSNLSNFGGDGDDDNCNNHVGNCHNDDNGDNNGGSDSDDNNDSDGNGSHNSDGDNDCNDYDDGGPFLP